MLRDYQRRAIDDVWAWIRKNDGNPCLVMPTGAGKSHVVAAMCREAVTEWPDTRVLMLTHVKELIEQNAEKMRQHWPAAPMGIYSASMRRRDLGEPITFAGIQSIRTRADDVGHVDLCLIDECHLVNHEEEGSYRTFLGSLWGCNPAMRVIGLTATPYRLGHGYITDKPALFDALIEPVSIEQLLHQGHLAPLRCRATRKTYDTGGVHTRGGEFIESELQTLVNTTDQNAIVADEIVSNGVGRKSWLVFCTGVDHAEAMRDALRARGIVAECVTGDTPKGERARILADFKAGRIQCVTNANVLTTGFDAPGVDLIAFCRPTMSTSLYMQMAGRGLRTADGKADCLVLDFAKLLQQHGPITNPRVGAKAGNGDPPVKECPECHELVAIAVMVCPCGYQFPRKEDDAPSVRPDLVDVDILYGHVGADVSAMEVSEWKWSHTTSKAGKPMLVATYYGSALSDRPVREYFSVGHEGYAGQKAWDKLIAIAGRVSAHLPAGVMASDDLDAIAAAMTATPPPSEVRFTTDGKFHTFTMRRWPHEAA
jgi:DNA repair protein RadD